MTVKDKNFVPGDDQCTSCTGISYFTSEMKEKNTPPYCFGKQGTPKSKISHDKLQALDKENMKKNASLGNTTSICMGYSQYTGRMLRRGDIPICVRGTELFYAWDNIKKQKEKESQGKNNDSSKGVSESSQAMAGVAAAVTAVAVPLSSHPPKATSAAGSQSRVFDTDRLKAVLYKHTTRMQRLISNVTAANFPERFQKSSLKLVQASGRTWTKCRVVLRSAWTSFWRRR